MATDDEKINHYPPTPVFSAHPPMQMFPNRHQETLNTGAKCSCLETYWGFFFFSNKVWKWLYYWTAVDHCLDQNVLGSNWQRLPKKKRKEGDKHLATKTHNHQVGGACSSAFGNGNSLHLSGDNDNFGVQTENVSPLSRLSIRLLIGRRTTSAPLKVTHLMLNVKVLFFPHPS